MAPETDKKFVSLLSVGLDSPVATYLMMKQGYDAVAVSFQTTEDPEGQNREKLEKLINKIVRRTGKSIKLIYIKYYTIQDEFIEKAERKITCILCKRLMLRIAANIAKKYGIEIIVNGDILGEQASQTLDNLSVVQNSIKDVLVIRPLIGYEKLDVIRIAQEIGTYELCSLPSPGCKKNPQYPETHAKLKEV